MEKRFEDMLNNDAFKSLEENKRIAIKEFIEKNQGKNANDIFTEIIKLNATLNQGKPLNQEQKNAIFEATLMTLNKEERNKLIKILSIFEKGF